MQRRISKLMIVMTIVTFIVPRGYRPNAGMVFAETGAVQDCDTPGGTGPCPGNDDPPCVNPGVRDTNQTRKICTSGSEISVTATASPSAVPIGVGSATITIQHGDSDTERNQKEQCTVPSDPPCDCVDNEWVNDGDLLTVADSTSASFSANHGTLGTPESNYNATTGITTTTVEWSASTKGTGKVTVTVSDTGGACDNNTTKNDTNKTKEVEVVFVEVVSIALKDGVVEYSAPGDSLQKSDFDIVTSPSGHDDLVQIPPTTIAWGDFEVIATCGTSTASLQLSAAKGEAAWTGLAGFTENFSVTATGKPYSYEVTGGSGASGTVSADATETDSTSWLVEQSSSAHIDQPQSQYAMAIAGGISSLATSDQYSPSENAEIIMLLIAAGTLIVALVALTAAVWTYDATVNGPVNQPRNPHCQPCQKVATIKYPTPWLAASGWAWSETEITMDVSGVPGGTGRVRYPSPTAPTGVLIGVEQPSFAVVATHPSPAQVVWDVEDEAFPPEPYDATIESMTAWVAGGSAPASTMVSVPTGKQVTISVPIGVPPIGAAGWYGGGGGATVTLPGSPWNEHDGYDEQSVTLYVTW